MAVGNSYGRGAYGTGPYARFSAGGRPYGVGPYGVEAYSRWGANTFDVAGHSLLLFGAQAATFRLDHELHGASGIVFDAWSAGMSVTIHPWAPTEIVFAVSAPLEFTWDAWKPCAPGGWQPTAGCEQGGWAAPEGCSEGAWGEVILETLP